LSGPFRSIPMRELSSSNDRPLVTAVIPTSGRPHLLACAIRSALRQTWSHLEVLVVVDGPDPDTERRLALMADPRLRTIVLPQRSGGSAARNAGVEAARGEWIAFLDDDDEWRSDKIERQMGEALRSSAWFPVVSCRVIAQSPSAARVLPRRVYDQRESVADYLFCRRSLLDPGGLIQTSTLLAPRDLLLAIPFQNALRMHQDWDWILRATSHEGVTLSMLAQPLTTWRVNDERDSVGRAPDWQFSLAWIRGMKPLISPRVFASFVAIQCAWRAERSRAGLLPRLRVLRAMVFEGAPTMRILAQFLVFCFIPQNWRLSICDGLRKMRGRSPGRPGLHLVSSRTPAIPALRRSSS
jgi:glycosyltransferase involved in cell wall biosynthesis